MVRSPPSWPAGCPLGLPASRALRHGARCSCRGGRSPSAWPRSERGAGALGAGPGGGGAGTGPSGARWGRRLHRALGPAAAAGGSATEGGPRRCSARPVPGGGEAGAARKEARRGGHSSGARRARPAQARQRPGRPCGLAAGLPAPLRGTGRWWHGAAAPGLRRELLSVSLWSCLRQRGTTISL